MGGPRGWWGQVSQGLRELFDRPGRDRDIEAELEHFYAEAEADLASRGLSREESHREVRLKHGDITLARDIARGYGWETWLEEALSDLRLAARRLRRAPGFTLIATLTLGLGIGAASSIFSVAYPLLMEPFGYPGEDRLTSLETVAADGSPLPIAFGTYLELQSRDAGFSGLAVYRPWQPTLTRSGQPEQLDGQRVSAPYFQVLGVAPALGPGFSPAHDHPAGPGVVVLSHGLWRDRFEADPDIVGTLIHLDALPFEVVGVMPPRFENGTQPGVRLWSLLQYDATAASFDSREWGLHLGMVGRLDPGVDPDLAALRLSQLAQNPRVEFPRPEWASLQNGFRVSALREATVGGARPSILVLIGAAGLLLAIAWANVSILVLARGRTRRGEMGMRRVLGAGRGRLARQMLVESLLLAGLGAVVGVVLTRVAVEALVAFAPASFPRLDAVGVDVTVLGFALVLTAVLGIAVSVLPALSGGSHQLLRTGQGVGRGQPTRSPSAQRALIAGEVALALVLLVGAGLLVRSTRALFSPGFDTQQRLVLQVSATGLERGDEPVHRFFAEVLTAVGEVPGVRSAATTTQLPLSGDIDSYGIDLDEGGGEHGSDGAPYRYAVSPGYLETMGIPVLGGRTMEADDDAESPPVAWISASLADRLFGHRDPLGQRLRVGAPELRPFTIVGVVGDVTQESLDGDLAEAVYVPSTQWHWADRTRWLVIHGERAVGALAAPVRGGGLVGGRRSAGGAVRKPLGPGGPVRGAAPLRDGDPLRLLATGPAPCRRGPVRGHGRQRGGAQVRDRHTVGSGCASAGSHGAGGVAGAYLGGCRPGCRSGHLRRSEHPAPFLALRRQPPGPGDPCGGRRDPVGRRSRGLLGPGAACGPGRSPGGASR